MADYAIHDTTLTGISNVIRKKEGSSALIDPADYPKRINLMGMLEEKTQASAPVCSFEDGADDVPIKSWEVEIAPTLTGKSAIEYTQTGKNLVDGTDFTRGLPSTTIGASIETISESTRYAYFGTAIKGGNYNVSSVSTDSDYYNAILIFGYSNGYLSVYTGGTVNGNKNVDLSACDYVRIAIGTRTSLITVPTDFTDYGTIQLEVGSTATTYEPYTAPTVSTVNLGRTVYGGTADVVKGEGSETYARIDLGTLNYTLRNGVGMQSNGVSSLIQNPPDNYTKTTAIATDYTADTWQLVMESGTSSGLFGVSGGYICFATTETDVATFKVSMSGKYLVFPLATPTDFTFTPITPTPETALGVNNFWADEGDTEVTYRSSGTITPIVPTLISKTITANGTYSAEDDDADGYDEVTVNVPSVKIVNSSIASFSDTDTTIPLLSVKSIVSPTSSGVSQVVFKHVGKNHIQKAKIVQGSFNTEGGDVDVATSRIRTNNYIPLTAGTYKIENKEGYEFVLYVYSSNDWQTFISAESLVSWQTYGTTFTLANNRYVRIGWRKSNNADILPSEIHDYILYDTSSLTQITANLGQTIYGGEVDAVNGTGTDEDGNDFTFTGQTINAYSGENNIFNASGNTEVEYIREVSS